MAHQVLVVFGGGYEDRSLACSMLGVATHFRRDPLAEVTAWSNLDLGAFVLEGQEMIFGRKEGLGGRRTVLTQRSHEIGERQYEVIPECELKQQVFRWVAEKSASSIPLKNMTIVFCAHGANGIDTVHQGVVLAAGTVLLGWSDQLSAIEPDELLSAFRSVSPSTQINLILLECFSGTWIERSLILSTHVNLFIHASCGQEESAYGLRSASNEFRCSLFAASVVEAINLAPNGAVAIYEENVHRVMEAAINHPTHPISQHTAVLHVVPGTIAHRAVGEILGFPAMWPNLLENARRMYQAASAWIFPQPPPVLPYGLDAVVVEEIYGKVQQVSLPDEALWRLMRSYLRGSPPNWLGDARKLQVLINFRRRAQVGMVQLAQAWEREGAVQLSAQGGLKLTSICSATRTNYRLLAHHLPELRDLSNYQHKTREVFRFSDPCVWIGNILGQPLRDGAMPSLVRLLDIAARKLGYCVSSCPHELSRTFELVPGIPGHPNTVNTIDSFLPVNVDQLRNFQIPGDLNLVAELGTMGE